MDNKIQRTFKGVTVETQKRGYLMNQGENTGEMKETIQGRPH